MKKGGLLGLAAIAALAASAGLPGTPQADRTTGATPEKTQRGDVTKGNPSAAAEKRRLEQLLRNGWGGSPRKPRRPGPGWTNRHVQRMAQKRRDVLRHRARIKAKGRK